ncbi:hypothetical protein [Peribacillus sp. NPDC058075]|uniref:hypothetical protein n=1 Tax=unclassified Peribacillus TaxID=2675266 RepID=UPI003351BFD3
MVFNHSRMKGIETKEQTKSNQTIGCLSEFKGDRILCTEIVILSTFVLTIKKKKRMGQRV